MKLIVTHEQPDADALASLALARLVHPGFRAALHGGLDPAMAALVRLYRDLLDPLRADEVTLDEVEALVVVDTADRRRIGPFAALLGRVPVTVYDHHPPADEPIPAARGLQEEVGATVTLLARRLEAEGAPVPAPLASLGLLGIHHDTGHLLYPSTTADDYRAAAFLLGCGASLGLVERFEREDVGDARADLHRAFRAALEANATVETVAGRPVVLAAFAFDPYLPAASGHVDDLREASGADAALVATAMGGKTLVFARAGDGFDGAAALREAFDGGGHPGAAFARSDLAPAEALRRAREALERHVAPRVDARALMSAPVTTVDEDATVAETRRLLTRVGHTGLPVLGSDGTIAGVVSRRDLDGALEHDLGGAPVAGVMTRSVVTAPPDATLEALEGLVMERGVGRVPIVEAGRLVGIVTRSDLLGARHAARAARGPAETVLARLPRAARSLLDRVVEEARGAAVYLVGGTVRDGLVGTGFHDLDVALEPPPGGEVAVESVGGRLQARLGGRLGCHPAFGTCTLELDDGTVLDLATAREERYEHAGALPRVRPSNLRRDLARRDFAVNAMALRLAPGPPALLDPYGGLADLEAKRLRVLHPLSFVEDPTRIVRGARLAGRLGFRFDDDARERARAALAPEVLAGVSRTRLRAELELTLAEGRVAPPLAVLDDLGALEAMYGLRPTALVAGLDGLRATGGVPDASYWLALLLALDEEGREGVLARFGLPRRLAQTVTGLAAVRGRGAVTGDEVEAMDAAERAVVRAMGEGFARQVEAVERAPDRRKLRGQDVIDLGLPPGPEIGTILERVASARADRRVRSFDDELALARRLVEERAPDRDEE